MTATHDTPAENDKGSFELMDNAAYDKDSDKSIKEVRIPLQTRLSDTIAVSAGNTGSCAHSSNGCRSIRASRAIPPQSSGGACYNNYNKILIVFLVLFIVWIIVYTVLSEMDLV